MDETNIVKRQNRRRIPNVVAMNKNLLGPKHRSPELYSKKNKEMDETKQHEHTSTSGVKTQVFVLSPDILKEMGININALQNDACTDENLNLSETAEVVDNTKKVEDSEHSANIKKTLNKKLRARANKIDTLSSQASITTDDKSNEPLITPLMKMQKNKGIKETSDYFIDPQQGYSQEMAYNQNAECQSSTQSKTLVELAPFSEFRVPKSPVTPKSKTSSNMETASFVKSYLTLSPGEEISNYISGYKNISISENPVGNIKTQCDKTKSIVQSDERKISDRDLNQVITNKNERYYKKSHKTEKSPKQSTSTSCINSLIAENDCLGIQPLQPSIHTEYTSGEQILFISEKETLQDIPNAIISDIGLKYGNVINPTDSFESREINENQNTDSIYCSDIIVENYSMVQCNLDQNIPCKETTESTEMEDFTDTLMTFNDSNSTANIVLNSCNIQDMANTLVTFNNNPSLVVDPQNIVEVLPSDQELSTSFYLTDDSLVSDKDLSKQYSNSVSVIQCSEDSSFRNTKTSVDIKSLENIENTNDFGNNIKIIAVEKGLFTTNVNFSARDLEVLRKTLDLTAGVDYNLCPLEKEVSPNEINTEGSSASDISVDTYTKHDISAMDTDEILDNSIESESSVRILDSPAIASGIVHDNLSHQTDGNKPNDYYNKCETSRPDRASNFLRENLVLAGNESRDSVNKEMLSNVSTSHELPPFESVVSKVSCMAVKSTIKDYFYSQINKTPYSVNERDKKDSANINRSSAIVCKDDIENSALRSPTFCQVIESEECAKLKCDETPNEAMDQQDTNNLNQQLPDNVLQNDEVSEGDCNLEVDIDYEGDISLDEGDETHREVCNLNQHSTSKTQQENTSKCSENLSKPLNTFCFQSLGGKRDAHNLDLEIAVTSESALKNSSPNVKYNDNISKAAPIKLGIDEFNREQSLNNFTTKKNNFNTIKPIEKGENVVMKKYCNERKICLLSNSSRGVEYDKNAFKVVKAYRKKSYNELDNIKNQDTFDTLTGKAVIKGIDSSKKVTESLLEKSKILSKQKMLIVDKTVLSDKDQLKLIPGDSKSISGAISTNLVKCSKRPNTYRKQNEVDSNMHGVEKPGGKLSLETIWKKSPIPKDTVPTVKMCEVINKFKDVPVINQNEYDYNIFADDFDARLTEEGNSTMVPMLEEDFIVSQPNNRVENEEFAAIDAAALSSFDKNIDLPFGYRVVQRNENEFDYLGQIILPSVPKKPKIYAKNLRTYSRPRFIKKEQNNKNNVSKISEVSDAAFVRVNCFKANTSSSGKLRLNVTNELVQSNSNVKRSEIPHPCNTLREKYEKQQKIEENEEKDFLDQNRLVLKNNSISKKHLQSHDVSLNIEELSLQTISPVLSHEDDLLCRKKLSIPGNKLSTLPTDDSSVTIDDSRYANDKNMASTKNKPLPPQESSKCHISTTKDENFPGYALPSDLTNCGAFSSENNLNSADSNEDPDQVMYEVFVPILDDDDENDCIYEEYTENCDDNSPIECNVSNSTVDASNDSIKLKEEEFSNIENTLDSVDDCFIVSEPVKHISIEDTIISNLSIEDSLHKTEEEKLISIETGKHCAQEDSVHTIRMEELMHKNNDSIRNSDEGHISPHDANVENHQGEDESYTSETCVNEEANALQCVNKGERLNSVSKQIDSIATDEVNSLLKEKKTKKPKSILEHVFRETGERLECNTYENSCIEGEEIFSGNDKQDSCSGIKNIEKNNSKNPTLISLFTKSAGVNLTDEQNEESHMKNVFAEDSSMDVYLDSNEQITADENHTSKDSNRKQNPGKEDKPEDKCQDDTKEINCSKTNVKKEPEKLLIDDIACSVKVSGDTSLLESKSEDAGQIYKKKNTSKSKKSDNPPANNPGMPVSNIENLAFETTTLPGKIRKYKSKKEKKRNLELIDQHNEIPNEQSKEIEQNVTKDIDASTLHNVDLLLEPDDADMTTRGRTKRKSTGRKKIMKLDDTSDTLDESTTELNGEDNNKTSSLEINDTTASKRKSKSKKIIKLTEEISSKKNKSTITCGICTMEMKSSNWKKHNLDFHKYLGWIQGRPPIDMNDEAFVLCLLNKALEHSKRKLICFTCKTKRTSAVGYLGHITVCQKTAEEIEALKKPCPVCNRYMLPQSLKVHIPIHSKVVPKIREEIEVKKEEEIIAEDGTRKRRRAAEKANLTIKKLKANVEEARDLHEFYTRPWRRVSVKHAKKVWKQKKENGNPMICVRAKCTFTDVSEEVMSEHFLNDCKYAAIEVFTCKGCPFKSDEPTMREHVMKEHRGWEGKNKKQETEVLSDDNELQHENEEDEEEDDDEIEDDDDDDESENETNFKIRAPRKKASMQKINESVIAEKKKMNSFLVGEFDSREKYNKWTEEFENQNYIGDCLFDNMLCNNYVPLDTEKAAAFLPKEQNSCKTFFQMYTEKSKAQRPGENEWRTFNLFESDIFNDSLTMWCGGPVFALGWVPGDKYSNYLAVSANPTMDYKLFENRQYSYKSVIQFWDVGLLCNKKAKCVEPAKMLFGIAHEYGNIWDLDWCPSSCCEDAENSLRLSGSGPRLLRMGLLAVACSDGNAYIYSVCDPTSLPVSSGSNIYHTEAVAQLELFGEESDTQKRNEFQATKLMWSLEKGHGTIVVGYSTGIVAFYDITSKSPLLKRTRGRLSVFSPYYVFQPYTSAINGLVIIPRVIPESGDPVIAVSSMSGCGAWSGNSMVVSRKGRYTNAALTPHWPNFFACSDPLAIRSARNAIPGSVTSISMRTGHLDDLSYRAGCSVSGSTSVSASWWNGCFVTAGTAGDVFIQPCQSHIVNRHRSRSFKKKKKIALLTYPLMVNLSGKTQLPRKKLSSAKTDKLIVMPKNKDGFIAEPANYNDTINQYGLLFVDVPWESGKSLHPIGPQDKDITVDRFSLHSVLCVKTHPSSSAHWFHAQGCRSGFVRIMCAKHLATFKTTSQVKTANIAAYF